MSFSLSMDGGSFEWSSSALFAQASNCTSPSFLMMLYEVLRFGREAPRVMICPSSSHLNPAPGGSPGSPGPSLPHYPCPCPPVPPRSWKAPWPTSTRA